MACTCGHPPLVQTPPPDYVPGAWFDQAAVDRVVRALAGFKQTKGRKWFGRPLLLEPWQLEHIVAPIFGWKHPDGTRITKTAWIELPRKNGKALDVDTPILTDRGWVPMGELKVGDLVHAPDGSPAEVVLTSEVFEGHRCFEVAWSDGQTVVADADHLWTVFDRWRARVVTVTTAQMAEDWDISRRPGVRERRYSVEVPAPLRRDEASLPVDPYLLGIWLGDGATKSARVTTADPEVLEAFISAGYRMGAVDRITTTILGLQAQLRRLGVLSNKHVPAEYLLASEAQRLALLQGLMDSDGTVDRGSSAVPRCTFTSTKRVLADGVLFLARSLGWKATIREGRAKLNGRDCGPKWEVAWCSYSDRPPFRLARKAAKLTPPPPRPARSRTIQVIAVTEVTSRPTRCIQVDHPSEQYLAGPGLIPTHNTSLCSGLALVLLVADSELGAEVYSAAAAKSQARQLFDPAKAMAKTCVPLRGKLRILKDVIEVPKTGSVFRVISSKGDLAHSLNVSGALVDEIHVHKSRDLIDALETGTGAREQPLVVFITTADEGDEHTIYAEKHGYTRKVADRVIVDPTHFGVIYAADEKDDPFDEATWRKANPGLGTMKSLAYMQKEASKARSTPAYLPTYLRLELNLRKRSVTQFADMGRWDAGGQLVRPDEWRGVKAYGGLDLSSVSDLTAWAMVADTDRGVIVDSMFWVPEDRVDALEVQCQVPLRQWAKAGFLKLTEGDVVDYAQVRKDILARKKALGVVLAQVAYDPYNAAETVQELEKAGVTMVPTRQGFLTLSPPTKELDRLIRGSRPDKPLIRHGGQPVLRWCIESTDTAIDPGENIKPVKPDRRKSVKRIDGTAALVNALSRLIVDRAVVEQKQAAPVRVR